MRIAVLNFRSQTIEDSRIKKVDNQPLRATTRRNSDSAAIYEKGRSFKRRLDFARGGLHVK
jgi:hypothetical protein